MDPLGELKKMAEDQGGSMTVHEIKNDLGEVVHGFATMSMPLRKDHWIYQKDDNGFTSPPMPLRIGAEGEISITITEADPKKNPGWVGSRTLTLNRRQMADLIRAAGKYAARGATMNGADMDFDPDALLQNLCVGFLGYWTADGLSGDDFANPKDSWTPPEHAPAQPGSVAGNTAMPTEN